MKDFFISYHRADRAWAEWIASHLEAVHERLLTWNEGDFRRAWPEGE
jgi:hypothetical protein